MTREEAIKQLESLLAHCRAMRQDDDIWGDDCEALKIAISALRPVSREQVEKGWRGEWKFEPDVYDYGTYVCSKCGEPWTLIDGTPVENNMNFCPACGAAQTDEAVQMMMERLEALYENHK